MKKITPTTRYIKAVKDFLISEYGVVKGEWQITLMALEDALNRYAEVKESIANNGIYNEATGLKNPLLSTEKDLLSTILKLTQKLGISPWDASKIKNTPDDDTDDFLNNLVGNDVSA